MFHVYIIEPIDLSKLTEAQKSRILPDGLTHVRGCILCEDYGVSAGRETAEAYLRAPFDFPAYFKEHPELTKDGLNLWTAYRFEIYWLTGIKLENIRPGPDPGSYLIAVPASQTVIGRLLK